MCSRDEHNGCCLATVTVMCVWNGAQWVLGTVMSLEGLTMMAANLVVLASTGNQIIIVLVEMGKVETLLVMAMGM